MSTRIKLGDLLVKAGVITELQLKAALAEQQKWGGKLGDILERMQYVTEDILVRAISKQTGLPKADFTKPVDGAALELVAREKAEEFDCLPLQFVEDGRALVVAMADPLNIGIVDQLRQLTGHKIVPQLAGSQTIRSAIMRLYGGEEFDDEATGTGLRLMGNSNESVPAGRAPPPTPQRSPPTPPRPAPAAVSPPPAEAFPEESVSELLHNLEQAQRTEVKVLKTMVELLIEKGIFTRDEYLARVRR